MDVQELGRRITRRRTELNLGQEDLAEMSGITPRTLYQIEKGLGNPTLQVINKVLATLGLEIHLDIRSTTE